MMIEGMELIVVDGEEHRKPIKINKQYIMYVVPWTQKDFKFSRDRSVLTMSDGHTVVVEISFQNINF